MLPHRPGNFRIPALSSISRAALFCALLLSSGIAADEIDTLYARLRADYLATLSASNAATYLSSLQTDGSWTDVDYANRSNTNWMPQTHLTRVRAMAVAFSTPANAAYQSTAMKDGITRALSFWYTRKPVSDNWWYNDIGQQLDLGKILVIMKNDLSAALLDTGCAYLNDPSMTGENLVWLASQTVQRGCLLHVTADVALGLDSIEAQARTTIAEGIQPDFSFHQHGPQLYSAGYGLGFMGDESYWAYQARGTSYAFSSIAIAALSGLLLQGDRWMVRGAMMDYSADGREISRTGQSTQANSLTAPCDRLSALDAANAAACAALKAHVRGGGADPLSGNRHFYCSDFMAHHRPAYYASIKMCSSRTRGTESLNSENLLGYWLPFGCTFFFRSGAEYADIFPVWDWTGLPGVTSPASAKSPGSAPTHASAFVGGVSDGAYGAAVMQLNKDSTVARKAWFLFDNELVALGAGITSTQALPVFTTVNQCLARGEVYVNGALQTAAAQTVHGRFSVFHDSIGYISLDSADASIAVESRTGAWTTINTSQSATPVTKTVFTCRITHGTKPSAAFYAYVVAPGISRTAFDTYRSSIPCTIAANCDSVQAAYHPADGIYMAAFHAPGSVAFGAALSLDVNAACAVIAKKSGGSYVVTAANPNSAALSLTIGITPRGTARIATVFSLPGGQSAGSSVTQTVQTARIGMSRTAPAISRIAANPAFSAAGKKLPPSSIRGKTAAGILLEDQDGKRRFVSITR